MNKILITFTSGFLAVLLTGMLFHRFLIFNIHTHYSQVIIFGFMGAVLYPLILYRERREIIFLTGLIVVLHFAIFKPDNFQFITRDILAISSVVAAVYIFTELVIPRLPGHSGFKVIALALTYAITNLAAFTLLSLIFYIFYDITIEYTEALLLWLKYGLMIGAGLGIGFIFAEFIIKNYIDQNRKHHQYT